MGANKIHRKSDCFHWCLLMVALCFSGLVYAQVYPGKSLRLIVPFPSGGGVDGVARIAFQRVSESLGQAVVIDNRGGSGGVIAAEIAARAAPDGYTLFFGTTSTQAITPHYYRKLPYDAVKDFSPVSLLADAGYLLVVHPALPVVTVKELVALAKARPGTLNFSSAGNGSMLHLTAEMFRGMTGLDLVHVPYKGSSPALADLLSGQIQLTFNPASVVLPHIKSGRLRGLGVTSAKRTLLAPELPTIAEAGVPGFAATGWYGVLAPAQTPPAMIQRISRALASAVADRNVKERFSATGVDAIGTTPEQFADFLRSEYTKWGKVVRAAGIKSE